MQTETEGDDVVVYSKYITRNGKKIPPPNGKSVWRFLVPKDKYKDRK